MAKKPIQVGDRVAYSRAFCQSTGQFTGDTPHARGTVTALKPLGRDPNVTILAVIEWDKGDLPSKVNVANLVKVKDIPFEPV